MCCGPSDLYYEQSIPVQKLNARAYAAETYNVAMVYKGFECY